ncbi:MAG: murein biosynthesis integral membrane protein MurJ, partial [Proteobacteria bacterium]|nr:murein biosynthesis integral membrane protein MurJ [Pseudomonadota bacterium]
MKKTGILRAVGVLGSTTLLSRLTGYIRDAVIAGFIGTSFYADAFFVAFRIPNMFRRLLGEGALTPAIVPVVSDLKDKPKDIRDSEIKSIISSGFFILLIITFLGILLSPLLVKFLAYGYTKNKELYDLTVYLNRLMFPYLFFVCMVAIFMGILNAYNHFFAPSFSPVLLNISMIFGIISLSGILSLPVYALAFGVLLGGLLQLLLQIPYLKKIDISPSLGLNLISPSTKSIYEMLLPSFFGLAITQINIVVDTLVASFLKEGTVSYLYYADRILEIPIGVIVVSFATAILPSISESARAGDINESGRQFKRVLKMCLLFVLPTMIVFISFGKPILSTLFQRKAFDEVSLRETYFALLGYSLG